MLFTLPRLVVSQNQRALHIVFPQQFLDSPEWFGVSTDDFFQVNTMALPIVVVKNICRIIITMYCNIACI